MGKINISDKFDPNADFINYQGDVSNLLMSIPDNFVQLIVTSPPYNIGKPYETRKDLSDYLKQQSEIIDECVRVLNPSGSICWQVGNFIDNGEIIPLDIVLFDLFSRHGLKLRNRIIWHFGHGLHARKRFSGRYEVVLWFTKTDDYIFNLDDVRIPQKYPNKKYFKGPNKGKLSGNPLGKNPSDVWEIPNVKANHVEKTMHPCQFPVELVERLILALSNENDWIFDPFMGVGSTAIASLIHNRKAIGAEIVEEYYQITQDRIKLAEEGMLRIRPMDREVYDPSSSNIYVPPQNVEIGTANQRRLFDRKNERDN